MAALLASLQTIVTSIDSSSLPKITSLIKQIKIEIQRSRSRNQKIIIEHETKITNQQKSVWECTTASNVKTNSVIQHDKSKQILNTAQIQFDALKDQLQFLQSSHLLELNALNKAEAECYLWTAQLHVTIASPNNTSKHHNDKEMQKAQVYFKIAIGRYRELYGISTDQQRDDFLSQMPKDTSKLVTAAKLSSSVLSSFDGLLGEASCCMARGNMTMRHIFNGDSNVKERMLLFKNNVVNDFYTSLNIFKIVGNPMEEDNVLNDLAKFYRGCEDWKEAGEVYHSRIELLKNMNQFSSMIEASMNEAKMFLQENRQEQKNHSNSNTTIIDDNDNNTEGSHTGRWLRRAFNASNTAVEMLKLIQEQNASGVLELKNDNTRNTNTALDNNNEGNLICQSWKVHSSVFQAAWEFSFHRSIDLISKTDSDPQHPISTTAPLIISTDLLPLNDSKLCITKAVECLQAAIDAAKDTISNDQEEALAHLYLELGSFQFTVVMNRRNHSTSTTAANNQDNDDQFLLLQAQKHLKKSMVSTK